MSVLVENGHINEYPYNHARILYGNVITAVTATGEVTNYPASAALTDQTYERWSPAVSGDSITATFPAQNVNCIALAAHSNLTPTVEIRKANGVFETVTAYPLEGPALSSDFALSDYGIIDYSPDNEAILFLIKPRYADAVRVTLTYTGAVPTLGVLRVGNVLEMQRPFYQGHTPAILAADTTLRPNVSESGEWLGASLIRQGRSLGFSWKNLKADWVRRKWVPFSQSLKTKPFIIAWNPKRFAADCFYASTSTVPKPNNSGPINYQSIDLQARAYSDGTDPVVENLAPVTFADQYTFTRASEGTYYDIGGVLQTAGVDEPRFTYDPETNAGEGLMIEESRTNLLQYSENFDNSAWVKLSSTTAVTPNYGIAPDGKLTADRLVMPVGGGTLIGQGFTASAANHTFSLWLRSLTGVNQTLTIFANSSAAGTADGTMLSLIVTDDWQRFDLTALFDAGTRYVQIDNNSNLQAVDVLVWGADTEAGSFVTSYKPSTESFTSRASDAWAFDSSGILQMFATDVARDDAYGYLDGILYPIGLLLEKAATNLLLNSDSPATQSVTVTNATQYTLSVYGTGSAEITAGGSGTATFGNDLTFTTTGTSVTVTVTGSLDYFQLETGPYATSIIVTAGTSATRAADISSSAQTVRAADVCARTLSDEFNSESFTVYCEFIAPEDNSSAFALSLGPNTTERAAVIKDSGGVICQVRTSGLARTSSSVSVIDGDIVKAAISYNLASGEVFTSVNGGFEELLAVTPDFEDSILRIGAQAAGSGELNSSVLDQRLIPRAYTQTELQALTA